MKCWAKGTECLSLETAKKQHESGRDILSNDSQLRFYRAAWREIQPKTPTGPPPIDNTAVEYAAQNARNKVLPPAWPQAHFARRLHKTRVTSQLADGAISIGYTSNSYLIVSKFSTLCFPLQDTFRCCNDKILNHISIAMSVHM
jgi:hypothetical protein